ncbi:hypothetical protein D9758_003769 [Tetrapyrgos nigripes]|uniref:Uncharacterized protein n=1 Tax=Tetrapyrgos nigripes TaxID=182062 RepID=A0A8H5GMS3_9AGAR|nr:hypothetical protein D9758_003769 [Tetrapyrgos nigripes]
MSISTFSLPLNDGDLFDLHEDIILVAIGSLFYGVNATLSFAAIYQLLKKGIWNSKPRFILCIVVAVMLSLSTVSLVIATEFPLANFTELSAYNFGVVPTLITRLKIALDFIQRLNYPINDGIVVWRAWVLYPQNCVVKAALVLCMVGSVAGILADILFGVVYTLRDINAAGKELHLMMAIPLLLTNMVATALIGYKTW